MLSVTHYAQKYAGIIGRSKILKLINDLNAQVQQQLDPCIIIYIHVFMTCVYACIE